MSKYFFVQNSGDENLGVKKKYFSGSLVGSKLTREKR
jgi:hypothetical protein